MGKLTILGNANPVIGQKEMYSVSSINDDWLNPLSNTYKNPLQAPKIHWEVMVQTKTDWRKGGSDKEGQTVPYTFGQKSLMHKGIKIIVQQGEDKGELIVHPQRAKEPKITLVELLDANYKPIPKGKKLSYRDTVIARAHCVEMFKMQVAFTLWEDDAKGEGHDPITNVLNKINPTPVLETVNIKGNAEAVFRLPFYTMAVQIANARIASGDKNEGATHEYYVTVDVVNTRIQKASSNVNVVNPTYEPPKRQRQFPQNTPPPKPAPPKEKPKPKPDSSKFPVTTGGKSQSDGQGKILSAEFVDKSGSRLHSSKVGTTVFLKITAKNMKNKKVKVKIWEEDNFTWTNDLIFEKDYVLVGDANFVWVKLTKKMFDKASDGSDSKRQDYFIEVIHNETSVTSEVMPVSADAEPTKVESGRTATSIDKPKQEKREEGKCPRCEADITLEEIKQIFPRSANNEKLAQQLIDELNSIKLKYGIDTCLKKAHMVTQMGSETEFRILREEIDGYSVNTLKSLFGYFKRHPDEAVTYQGNIYELAIRAYGLRAVDKEKDIVSCSVSRTKGCNDLGNETKEDGYTYLGRGLIQLTGKYQYTLINKDFQKAFPNKGNLVKNPELLEKPEYAVMSGLSYWINNGLNTKAEKGSEGEHVDAITKIINRNLDESHYKRRRDFFKKAKIIFKIDECKNKKDQQPISDIDVEVVFDEGTNKSIVSNKSINILKKIAKASKTPRVVITSTARTPLEQATIMYDQTKEKGVKAQKALYGPNGEIVIDVYVKQKSLAKNRQEVIKKMEEKINELGPSKVSRHCGNQHVLNVFDVSSSRMSNASAFLNEARKYEGTGKEISKIINETDRSCYHFEIPQ